MPNVSQTVKFRNRQRSREIRRPLRKLGLVSAVLASLLMVFIIATTTCFYFGLVKDIPSVDKLPTLLNPPDGILLQPTRLYDRSHQHVIQTLENPAATSKQYLSIAGGGQQGSSQAVNYLINATIAELDPGFWQHGGYSLSKISDRTHPTLAQRLVSDLLLDAEPASLRRNLRERLLAAAVTAKFGREKVLEWYLNTAKFGTYVYGADAAARTYFAKPFTDISLAQSAMLVALAENPSLDPFTSYQTLKQQQDLILRRMLAYGLVSADDAQAAMHEIIHFQAPLQSHSLAPAFTQLVIARLNDLGILERLSRGGYDVITSLDYDLQIQSLCTSQAQVANTQAVKEPIGTVEGVSCQADQLLPPLQAGNGISNTHLLAEVVVIEPQSGQVLAMVGGEGTGLLPVPGLEHPAGSILSPFMYLAAFTHGFSPASLLWDVPVSSQQNEAGEGQATLDEGFIDTYHGPVSLRSAFINDYEAAGNQVLDQLGQDVVRLTEQQFGIQTPGSIQDATVNLETLYSQPALLLEVTQAYAVLANDGIMAKNALSDSLNHSEQPGWDSTIILKVASLDGQVLLDESEPQSIPIVSPQIIYLTTDVLADEKTHQSTVIQPDMLGIGRPVALKTSLRSQKDAAWAIGYIPQLAVGVWMGITQGEAGDMSLEATAGLWKAIIQYASQELSIQDFSVPDGISKFKVCAPSGLLESSSCPSVVDEVFLSGNEPTQVDDLYQMFFIDRETGLLATIFTPRDKVEEEVFLMVPPQAVEWARQAGLTSPPDKYDSLDNLPPVSADAQFTRPQMFDHIRGKVILSGSATGEGFSYYRLQVGRGLYPQKWLQLGEDADSPVEDGVLGEWDTSGLEGVYIIELMVVKQDRRLDQAFMQVVVDNTPPQVRILSPRDGQQYSSLQDEEIMLNILASDNQDVNRVEFYVDDQLVSTLLEPPYTILWDTVPSEHTMQVRVYDSAGNQAVASSSFQVLDQK